MEQRAINHRSDVRAKEAFCRELERNGFANSYVASTPADIVSFKDGMRWLFELKFTQKEDVCFGAATLTEWAAASSDPEHFRFVIAYETTGVWQFDQYTPEEFMAFSSVPPFKIYFSVPLNGAAARKRAANSKRIYLTKSRLRLLSRQFEELRTLED